MLTAGLGGMGGAQGLGITLNGGRALIVEVDPRRARRRADAGWIDLVTDDYRHAIASLDDPDGPELDRPRRQRRRGRSPARA